MKKRRHLKTSVKFILIIILLVFLIILSSQDEHRTIGKFFGGVKDVASTISEEIDEIVNKEKLKRKKELEELSLRFNDDYEYSSKSILVYDLKNKGNIFTKDEQKIIIPASLTKLFVIDYVFTLTNSDDLVEVTNKVLSMPKKNSSLAKLRVGNYLVSDLMTGMLIPSGNDASYALAEHCGKILNPDSLNYQEEFLKGLNNYLHKHGYKDTIINDPSGYDLETKTSSTDLLKLNLNLLTNNWFREIVRKETYDFNIGENTVTWKNTNPFLNINSPDYNPNVFGIKTGGLKGLYNLVTLVKIQDKEYIIITLEALTEDERVSDIKNIIEKLDY